jgi:UDP-N-acetylglucosamine 2-epimerase (non-hydrolysing)
MIVHTGQNYDYNMNDVFFKELGLRQPDIFLEAKSSTFGGQVSIMLEKIEKVFKEVRPDKVVILGDTNSGLCAIVAERMRIPVYHLEAGNRCFDRSVPEEVNRKLIDSISTYNLPYTPGSRENLINEGVSKQQIFTCGNPIGEVLQAYGVNAYQSHILNELSLEAGNYFLATFHRAETVDFEDRLKQIIDGLIEVENKFGYPIVCSIHPRTRDKLNKMKYTLNKSILFLEPFGFLDFVNLEKNAFCILTDSGTVSEEACILGVPCVIIRDITERPEILECGSAMLSGVNSKKIADCVEIMRHRDDWKLPIGYGDYDVSDKVVQFILGGIIRKGTI